MPDYTVKWEINVEAEDPRKAAEEALNIQRDENSLALAFDVTEEVEESYSRVHVIDLLANKATCQAGGAQLDFRLAAKKIGPEAAVSILMELFKPALVLECAQESYQGVPDRANAADNAVILVGNPRDGFSILGPFEDPGDAVEYAGREITKEEWSVQKLLFPSSEQDCEHPVHSNPGLIVPCPECGAGDEEDCTECLGHGYDAFEVGGEAQRPEGFCGVEVERCDSCGKFSDDADARDHFVTELECYDPWALRVLSRILDRKRVIQLAELIEKEEAARNVGVEDAIVKRTETTWMHVVQEAKRVRILGEDCTRFMIAWLGGGLFKMFIVYTNSARAVHVDTIKRDLVFEKSCGVYNAGTAEWANMIINNWIDDNIDGDSWMETYE